MAYFAKINSDNIVEQIIEVHNNELLVDGIEDEQQGINFIHKTFGTNDTWKQTSYHTAAGVHKLGGTPFRKNYAGEGYTYDATRDAFYEPKPYNSWILNETTCLWEAPVAQPDDNKSYEWNEETLSWDLVKRTLLP